MADESLLEEVESELEPADTTWWIVRVLSIRVVLICMFSLFFTLGLGANGVAAPYLFGWGVFVLLLAIFVFKK